MKLILIESMQGALDGNIKRLLDTWGVEEESSGGRGGRDVTSAVKALVR
jgi:hypothetical protein